MSETTEFWRGKFGDEYLARNKIDHATRVPFWESAIDFTQARTVLEIGCNRGHNLMAIQSLGRDIECRGLDINQAAVQEACSHGVGAQVGEAKDAPKIFGRQSHDLVITAGLLIHVPPDELREVMTGIVECSKRYVISVEYEAAEEEAVEYRGHEGKLWKRPFGELYVALGMRLVHTGDAEGFDRCTVWMLEHDTMADALKAGWVRKS